MLITTFSTDSRSTSLPTWLTILVVKTLKKCTRMLTLPFEKTRHLSQQKSHKIGRQRAKSTRLVSSHTNNESKRYQKKLLLSRAVKISSRLYIVFSSRSSWHWLPVDNVIITHISASSLHLFSGIV